MGILFPLNFDKLIFNSRTNTIMNKSVRLLITLFLLTPFPSVAHDFPTQETVRFVLDCMTENGGINDESFYYCTCRHDAMANNISFSDYEEGVTYERNKDMPGDKGAVFRNIERGKEKYKELLQARTTADSQCTVVKKVSR